MQSDPNYWEVLDAAFAETKSPELRARKLKAIWTYEAQQDFEATWGHLDLQHVFQQMMQEGDL